MAYPMRNLTLGEFIAIVTKDHGVEVAHSKAQRVGPRGPTRWRYLKRTNGIRRLVPLEDMPDDEHLMPRRLGSLCNRLGIDVREIPGYELGIPGASEEE